MPGPETHQGKTKPRPFESLRGIIPRFKRFMNAPATPEYRKMLKIDASGAAFAGALMLPATKSGLDKLSKIDDQNHLIYEIQHYDLYPDSVINSIESMDIVPESVKVFRSNPFDNRPENNKFNISFTSKNADLFIPLYKNRQALPQARITLRNVPLNPDEASDFHRFLGGKWEASDYYRMAFDVSTALGGTGVAVKGYQLGGSKGTIISGLGSLSAIGALSDLTKSKISFFQNLKGPSQDIVAQMAIVPAYNQAGIEVEIEFLKSCIGIGDQPTQPIEPTPIHEPAPGPTFEITPTPEKPIEITAEEWASNKETGMVIPEKIFPTVGCIALPVDDLNPDGEKLPYMHHRAIDLKFQSLNLTFVTDVNLHEEGFSDHQGIRQFIANDMNKQKKLLDQLKTIDDELKDRGEVYVVIDGKNPGKGLSTPEPGSSYPEAYVSNIAVKSPDGSYIWYKIVDDGNGGEIQQLTKEEEPKLLPELKVSGAQIERVDLPGEYIQFKGFNILNFDRPSGVGAGKPTFADTKQYIDLAMGMNSNLIRLQIDMLRATNNINELEKVINYAEQLGMYVVLSPTGFNDKMNNDIRDETMMSKIKNELIKLTQKFKNKNNIFYGLINEVGFWDQNLQKETSNWDDWEPLAKDFANGIREINPNAPIVLALPNWNRDGTRLIEGSFGLDNFMVDVHNYANATQSPNDGDITESIAPSWKWKQIITKNLHPVLISEAGQANWGSDSPLHKLYIEKSLNIVDQNPKRVHYTAFALFPPGQGGTFTLLEYRPNLTLNSIGNIYKDDMTNSDSLSPITDFRN